MSRIYEALEKAERDHKAQEGFFPGLLEEDPAAPAAIQVETGHNGNGKYVEEDLPVTIPPDNSYSAEQFRKLKTHIFRRIPHPRSILITSCAPKEGKTTVSMNLAFSISQEIQKRTILVDADLRKPSIYRERFGGQKGLSDYLSNEIPFSETLKTVDQDNFMTIPGGTPTSKAAELINSNKLKELLKNLHGYGDNTYVIIDSPPVLSTSESLLLSEFVDGVILVIMAGMVSKLDVRKVVKSIGPQKIIGVVFNQKNLKPLKSYSYYESYYGYGKKNKSLLRLINL
jgi:protein-tyrosine kinase